MTDIKTWVERCEVHPDHQTGMVSHAMIQMRMQEEIDALRAENERLREALTRITNGKWTNMNKAYVELREIARAALKGDSDE